MNEPIPFQGHDRATGAAQFFSRVQRYKTLLKRRWWVLLLTFGIAVGAQTYRASKTPLTYVSKAQMIVGHRVSVTDSAAAATDENFVGTTIALLQGNLITTRASEVLRAKHLAGAPVTLKISLAPKTSIFILEARGAYPKYTQAYLNACMEEFLKYRDEMRGQSSTDVLRSITEQMGNAQKQIDQGRAEQVRFQTNHMVAFVEEDAKSTALRLNSLQNDLAQLRQEYQLLDALTNTPSPRRASDKPELTVEVREQERVRTQLAVLEQQKAELEEVLKPKHPKMIRVEEQIAGQKKLLQILDTQSAEQFAQRRESLQKQIATKQTAFEEESKRAREASTRLAEYETIKSRIDDAKSLYGKISSMLEKVKIEGGVPVEPVSILEPASIAKADNSGFTKNIIIGCFIGLVFGIGLLFLLDRFDDRPVSFTELQEHFDELILGQIPQDATRARDRKLLPLTANDTRYAYAEAHRNLRSSLIFMAIEGARPRTIVITSAVPGEGKSTVAVNLAITMASSGSRVLLIDADMRKGTVHEYFELGDQPGLADVLGGDTLWDKVIHQTHVPNLSVIPRGKSPPNPGELLLTGADALIKDIYQYFDFILFDSAPVLAADDTASLAPKADGTLFVIRAAYTSARLARNALDLLYQRQVNVMGIVFNSVETNSREYYYFKYPEYYAKGLVTK
ncbi:MAG TPA: polysaccharide biosynthesis tyrosine autokinase [Methylomirabilota bacterium]|nr:polysaccharide biosynthesis tyrosine autokinase [Methylomirabilota bacterium]